MATQVSISLGTCTFALLAAMATASAAPPGVIEGKQKRQAAPAQGTIVNITPKQRGEMTRQFVNKWGVYVQRVYGVPVRVWATRMVPNFASADAGNFRNALKRDTYEGAMAELAGTGHRLSDSQVIDRLAKIDPGAPASKADVVAAKFGDLNQDLVYTPLQPCRIVDTRSTAAGAIAASTTRSFVAVSSGSFASQGGSATSCGTLGLSATAVALNVTAVGYTSSGHAIVFPFGTAMPNSSSVNFNAGNFATNNGIIAKIPNPLSSFDFTVWTAQSSHFVVDIVGYFAPPLATGLQCVETANTDLTIGAGGTGNAVAPDCAAGYTQTATNCESSTWQMPFVFFQSGTCSAQNNSSGSATLKASRTCCRVPGR